MTLYAIYTRDESGEYSKAYDNYSHLSDASEAAINMGLQDYKIVEEN